MSDEKTANHCELLAKVHQSHMCLPGHTHLASLFALRLQLLVVKVRQGTVGAVRQRLASEINHLHKGALQGAMLVTAACKEKDGKDKERFRPSFFCIAHRL